jgi:hypothetical protein
LAVDNIVRVASIEVMDVPIASFRGSVQRTQLPGASAGRVERRRHARRSACGTRLEVAPSAVRNGQAECRHLVVVANEQDVADQHGMIPGLALERGEASDLFELAAVCFDQRKLAFL